MQEWEVDEGADDVPDSGEVLGGDVWASLPMTVLKATSSMPSLTLLWGLRSTSITRWILQSWGFDSIVSCSIPVNRLSWT